MQKGERCGEEGDMERREIWRGARCGEEGDMERKELKKDSGQSEKAALLTLYL